MKHLLNFQNIEKQELEKLIDTTLKIETNNSEKINSYALMKFDEGSTRTRLSFQVGINQLQGKYIDIKLEELNLQRVESFEDTFEIMSCYLDALVFRTTNHEKLKLALLIS